MRPYECPISVSDAFSSEGSGCGDDVFATGFAAEPQQLVDEGCSVLLASGRFRWSCGEVRITHQRVQYWLQDNGAFRRGSIAVVSLIEETLHQRIDDHVCRAGVEGEQLVCARVGWNSGEISDSAEVLQH